MKKLYIIIASSIAVLFLSIIVGIKIYENVSFNGIEEVYVIKTNYTYNTSTNNKIEILVYSNNPKSFINEYEDVVATLTSGNTALSATVEEVKKVSTHSYKEQRVYGYKMYVQPFEVNLVDDLSNCKFKTRDFEVNIGNLSVVGITKKSSNLDFSKIYAIGNEHLGYKSINAFVITFTNSGSTPLYITDFYIGGYNKVNLNDAVILSSDIKYGDDIKEYIKDYNPLKYSSSIGTISVPSKGSVRVLIPVHYSSKSFLGNTLMCINNSLYIDNYNYLTNYDDLDNYKSIINEAELNNT